MFLLNNVSHEKGLGVQCDMFNKKDLSFNNSYFLKYTFEANINISRS